MNCGFCGTLLTSEPLYWDAQARVPFDSARCSTLWHTALYYEGTGALSGLADKTPSAIRHSVWTGAGSVRSPQASLEGSPSAPHDLPDTTGR
jgi:hypothetical protein